MDFSQAKHNYGTLEQVSPLITKVLCKNPSPYTYTGTQTYFIGDKSLAIIDPGPVDMEHGEALLRAIGERDVSHILVTHTHMDHSPLSAWLSSKTGAKIIGYGRHGSGRAGGLEFEDVEAGADKNFFPHKIIADGDIINGNGWTIECVHTPGHTSNHICFKLIEENTIFVGDHLMAWATTVISPPDGDMRAYLKSLEKLKSHNAEVLLPTHGGSIDNPRAFIRGVLIHRRMREGQILERLKERSQTIEEMVKSMYKDVDKRLHGAAARSVFAHIIALHDEGRITCEGDLSLTAQYKLMAS
jgi:glyoxylase-like metal-dependent hydrolase (beta-lactamase superfamily II)